MQKTSFGYLTKSGYLATINGATYLFPTEEEYIEYLNETKENEHEFGFN